MLKPFFTN